VFFGGKAVVSLSAVVFEKRKKATAVFERCCEKKQCSFVRTQDYYSKTFRNEVKKYRQYLHYFCKMKKK